MSSNLICYAYTYILPRKGMAQISQYLMNLKNYAF
jgi:hypothetical protein